MTTIAALALLVAGAVCAQPEFDENDVANLTERIDASVQKVFNLYQIVDPALNNDVPTGSELQAKVAELEAQGENCSKLSEEVDVMLAQAHLPVTIKATLPKKVHELATLSDGDTPSESELTIALAVQRANVAALQGYILKLRTIAIPTSALNLRAQKRLKRCREALARWLTYQETMKLGGSRP